MSRLLDAEQVVARGHPVWAEVDLGAIRHNVATLRALAPEAELMAVVKGYAYGHGNPASARTALEGGASRLGVARVAEALHLRDGGITAPIHVFSEPPVDAAPAMVANDLTATIYTEAFARALAEAAAARGSRVRVHLKVDTGMHRVGLPADDLPGALATMERLPDLEIEGVWSHFAVADLPDHPFTRRQLDLFLQLVDRVERAGHPVRYRHIANSAAVMSLPESHLDLVRCGIALYGLWPGQDLVDGADLRPAMSLRARVSMVKKVPAGGAVSYGLTYSVTRESRIVTVGAGYADGYDRRLSGGRADVLLDGRRYTVSGTVCMDQFMVDVGDDSVGVGDAVTLLGSDGSDRITAEELAGLVGTINYEITTRVPSRVPRVFVGEQTS